MKRRNLINLVNPVVIILLVLNNAGGYMVSLATQDTDCAASCCSSDTVCCQFDRQEDAFHDAACACEPLPDSFELLPTATTPGAVPLIETILSSSEAVVFRGFIPPVHVKVAGASPPWYSVSPHISSTILRI